ncbi:MAG: glutathione S-transferase C-terminal domain-containing protein, partial [Actinobacteria bacterium]|nr:glutathione S-transferase C-terminal domain-containing protein [Actinomycetota bacterium]
MTRTSLPPPENFASSIDAYRYGEYRRVSTPDPAARYRFADRVTGDGRSGFTAMRDRYHVYVGWFCPLSHRVTIQRALNGLQSQISVSYVDGLRDARGWAFRPATGPDSVNGFSLLHEAYVASDAGYDGPVSIPVLWDRRKRRIVSNDPDAIEHDLAVEFAQIAQTPANTYPLRLRPQIDELTSQIRTFERTVPRAIYWADAKNELRTALRDYDRRLDHAPYLLGDHLTIADIRLWVSLVRYDTGVNAHGAAGPQLRRFDRLWEFCRTLYRRPAFRLTTDFDAFRAPLTPVNGWDDEPTSA